MIGKGQYRAGDLAAYLPEGSILPDTLIARLDLVGKLAGGAKNRIRAVKLRGCLSQGILVDVPPGLCEGDDASNALGVVKYEPAVPSAMGGTLRPAPRKTVPTNLYTQTILAADIPAKIKAIALGQDIHVLGEIFGLGVQDLAYNTAVPQFRAFEVYVGPAGAGRYMDRGELADFLRRAGIPRVPVLYRGMFTREVLAKHTDGLTIIGDSGHIREGVVITPMQERTTHQGQRVCLKSVSAAYLLRKGEITEHA